MYEVCYWMPTSKRWVRLDRFGARWRAQDYLERLQREMPEETFALFDCDGCEIEVREAA